MRDNTELKKMMTNSLLFIKAAGKTSEEAETYKYTTDLDNYVLLTPNGTDDMEPCYARLFITDDAVETYLIDTLKMRLRAYNTATGVATKAFKVEFYHEIPSIGYLKLIDTVYSEDLESSAGGAEVPGSRHPSKHLFKDSLVALTLPCRR